MDIKAWFNKNSSSILTITACVGVAVTGVLTYFGTIKAQKTIKEWTEEKRDELTTFEKVQASAKPLLPAVAAGIGTIVCVAKAQSINKRDIAIFGGGAAAIAKKYDDYRKTNIKVNGKEAHDRVMDELAVSKAKMSNISAECLMAHCSTGAWWDDGEEHTFYDSITDQYFESTLSRVIDAQYHLNRNFFMGYPEVDVQMWCDFLGIENKKKDTRGWALCDEFQWIDFNNRKPVDVGDGLMVSVIDCAWTPRKDYLDFDTLNQSWNDDEIDDVVNDSKLPF